MNRHSRKDIDDVSPHDPIAQMGWSVPDTWVCQGCKLLIRSHDLSAKPVTKYAIMGRQPFCQTCFESFEADTAKDKAKQQNAQSTPQPNVLEEALGFIYGDRQDAYGPVTASFQRIARLWTEVLGFGITADQVALCLVQLKIARALNDVSEDRPIKRDTIVDIAGYAGCLGKLLDGQ